MNVKVLIDTGPLVALLDANDAHHRWSVAAFASFGLPMFTCEAVLGEVCFLLARWPAAVEAVFHRVALRALRLESMAAESAAVCGLMNKYRSVPASYADACLVRLSERHASSLVLTTDSDFHIYRRNGRQPIRLKAPFTDS